ncbi:MAG: VanW family protein [Armatimonadota bacterium]|nr:VanW family protein [bacterium]MDW8320568.1 VanW family protein [Armatimonadota bacterium]
MSGFRYLWARAVTRFNPADRARVQNIRLATQKVDGKVLAPGATFSFNQAVGSRQSPESGFAAAPVFTDKGRVRALGGGVCQVSSTLYAAVLLTDLEVLERHAHAMPVPYLDPGLDATVSNRLDLRIRNPHPFAVQFRLSVHERRLQAEVWGEKPPSTRSRLMYRSNRCMRDGVSALQVTVWRLLPGGRRQKMSEDIYYVGR